MKIVNIDLQFSQFVPLYPAEHEHWYTFPRCWQNPPFWQGFDAQGLTGEELGKEKKITNDDNRGIIEHNKTTCICEGMVDVLVIG